MFRGKAPLSAKVLCQRLLHYLLFDCKWDEFVNTFLNVVKVENGVIGVKIIGGNYKIYLRRQGWVEFWFLQSKLQ